MRNEIIRFCWQTSGLRVEMEENNRKEEFTSKEYVCILLDQAIDS